MSDAMNSVEIEDVLSSIRRLVSEDLHSAPPIVSKIVTEDKLILTPNLRVVRPEAKPMPMAQAVPQPRLHLSPAHMVVPTAPRGVKSDVVVSLGEAVGHSSLDWESETGDPGPEADGLDWSSFTFARRSLAEGRGAFTATAPVKTAPEEPSVEQPAAASDWADEEEPEVLADLNRAEPMPVQPTAEVLPGEALDEDNIFSEQVLRELVRDLIRTELQGDLGERITRNIRKLVRAEIASAIAVQSLE